METNKVGNFIAELRKSKKMTQKELADKLYITDRAVSKWERGLNYPDITSLEKLSQILDVSVIELLKGEKNPKEDINNIICENISLYQSRAVVKTCKKLLIGSFLFFISISLVLVIISEYSYGSISLFGINISIPNFSSIVSKKQTDKFVKALKKEDYETINNILLCKNAYETEESLKDALDVFYNNFEIKDISHQSYYYDGQEYQNTYIINLQHEQFEYKINLELTGRKEQVLITGYGYISSSSKNNNLSNNKELSKIIENLFNI